MVFGGSKNKQEGRFRSNKSRVGVIYTFAKSLRDNGDIYRAPLIRQQTSCILQTFHVSIAKSRSSIRSLVSKTLTLGALIFYSLALWAQKS